MPDLHIPDGLDDYDDDFTTFGLDFIRQHYDHPFFLYLAYTIPHGRYEVPDVQPYTDSKLVAL